MIVLLDATNLLMRSIKSCERRESVLSYEGHNTGPILTFIRTLGAYLSRLEPERFVAVFDSDWPLQGHFVWEGYKGNRGGLGSSHERYQEHFRLATEWLALSNLHAVSYDTWEADQIIAGYVDLLGEGVVMSDDKDLLQLVGPKTKVVRFAYGAGDMLVVDEERFAQDYSVTPALWPMVKAIMGDNSDGLDGVRGLGPVKAGAIVNGAEGSLWRVLHHPKVRPHWRVVLRNYRLMRLLPLPWSAPMLHEPPRFRPTTQFDPGWDRLASFYDRYGLDSIRNLQHTLWYR